MTLSQLQQLTLSWLDDPNAGYFTLPQVNVWLNNAQKECQKQLLQANQNWYVTAKTTTTVENIDTYILPDDFLKINRLELITQGSGATATTCQLSPVTMVEALNFPVGPGTPECYWLKRDCLVLVPVPQQAWTIRLNYSYRVGDMQYQGSEPDVPEQFQEYLAVLATLDGFLKDQRDPTPMLIEKKKSYLELMKQDSQNRTVDAPRMVNSTDQWDVGYLY